MPDSYEHTSAAHLRRWIDEILRKFTDLYVELKRDPSLVRKHEIVNEINRLQRDLEPLQAALARKQQTMNEREQKKKRANYFARLHEIEQHTIRQHKIASDQAYAQWFETNRDKMLEKGMTIYDLLHCAWMASETWVIKRGMS